MSTYSPLDHTNAIIAAIEALGVTVGDGGGDQDGSVQTDLTPPYAVVYALGSTFAGSMATDDLDSDAWPTTQVTFVGVGREQVQWLQNKVRVGLVGQRLTVANRALGIVRLHMELPAGRDTTVTPYLWWAVDQYRCYSTPA
jgi:hypothetical protein